jgi:hypothetical protein
MWKVQIWEYERGWGSRLDEVKTFVTHPEAVIFQKEFNSKNTETVVPDWYMVAKEPYYAEE